MRRSASSLDVLPVVTTLQLLQYLQKSTIFSINLLFSLIAQQCHGNITKCSQQVTIFITNAALLAKSIKVERIPIILNKIDFGLNVYYEMLQNRFPTFGLFATRRSALGVGFVYQLALWYRFEQGQELCADPKALLKSA